MEIQINDQKLDVNLDNEKTIGEILSVLEKWLSHSGHILSGLCIDGFEITASEVEEAFSKEIDSVKHLNIKTTPIAEIAASSLVALLDDIKEYEVLNFKDKSEFFNNWKNSAAGKFIESEIHDLYQLCVNTFSHGETNSKDLYSITEERLREITEPEKEFNNIETVLNDICEKLIDLPLDIQTGKDIKAAKTIQLFTAVTEKIIRIFYQFDTQGYFLSEQKTKTREILVEQISDFTGILKELLEAYEKNDSVLVGDLAEYEASVKIKELYKAILQNCRREK